MPLDTCPSALMRLHRQSLRTQLRDFAASILLILGIFALDFQTPVDVYLHVLYGFPLAYLTYRCTSSWMRWTGGGLAIFAQVVTFGVQIPSSGALAVDCIVVVGSTIFMVVLVNRLRLDHLALARMATTDVLTGLKNRRYFTEMLAVEIFRQLRYGGVFSLIAIDLDKFKQLNDTQGHEIGDRALVLLATTLLDNTRSSDVVARLGGDEFCVLLPRATANDAAAVASLLTDAIAKAMRGVGYDLTASVGAATFAEAPASTSAALKSADQAMYRVKQQRRFVASGTAK